MITISSPYDHHYYNHQTDPAPSACKASVFQCIGQNPNKKIEKESTIAMFGNLCEIMRNCQSKSFFRFIQCMEKDFVSGFMKNRAGPVRNKLNKSTK